MRTVIFHKIFQRENGITNGFHISFVLGCDYFYSLVNENYLGVAVIKPVDIRYRH